MNYDLADLIKARGKVRRPTALFPSISHSPALELGILRALRRMEHAAAAAIRDILIPRYKQVITTDADATSYDLFRGMVNAQATEAEGQVTQLLELEAKRHTAEFMKAARRTFGVDLSNIISSEDLTKYMEQATLRNASLIRSLADDIVKRVQQEVTSSVIAGRSAGELRERLREQLGFADSRARLIARDQTAKFNSDLNQQRHQQAGMTTYIWRTSQDERVRSRHRELEGKVYEYGKPTGAEEGLPPGQPIQCRCIAQAVVEFPKAEAPKKPDAATFMAKQIEELEKAAPPPKPKPKAAPKPKVKSWAEGGPMPPAATAPAPKPKPKPKAPPPPPKTFFVNPNYQPGPAPKPGQPGYDPLAPMKPKPGMAGYKPPAPPEPIKLTTPRVGGRKPPAGTVGLDVATPGGRATVDAAVEVAEKSGAKYASGRKHKAVNEYIQGSDWREFNENLRTGSPLSPKHSQQAADLDAIVSASPLKKPLVVYRGVSSRATNLTSLEVGDAFIDPSFMSTSVRPDVSEGFAGNGVLMRILLPKGHKASIIGLGDDVRSSMDYEAEVLLGRGMHFRVVATSMENAGSRNTPMKVIDLEVVPNG